MIERLLPGGLELRQKEGYFVKTWASWWVQKNNSYRIGPPKASEKSELVRKGGPFRRVAFICWKSFLVESQKWVKTEKLAQRPGELSQSKRLQHVSTVMGLNQGEECKLVGFQRDPRRFTFLEGARKAGRCGP